MTKYTDKELMTEARKAVKLAASGAKVKARCEGYTLWVSGTSVTLIAHAVRTDNHTVPVTGGQYRFDVNIAI